MPRESRDPSTSRPGQNGPARGGDAARLLRQAEERDIRFINLEFTDVVGMAKSVTIPREQLADALAHGKWFDGSSIEGFARVAETDMYLRPDLATFAEVPWRTALTESDIASRGRVARLICDVMMPSGERFEGDPRGVLIAAQEAAAALGLRYEVAPELEFFLLHEEDVEGAQHKPLPHDRGGYFDLSTDLAADIQREIISELDSMSIGVESSHHEVAAGQHEIDLTPAAALHVADAIVTARYVIKAIAQRHGLWATFLPKPFYGINGSGMHTHQQLVRLRDHANAFMDTSDLQYGLSKTARQFIAGQLAHAQGMSAVLNPLVNSYKRLVPGFEAPVMVTWGRVNREALIRVPRAATGIPGGVRIELRSPDPSCNPYLAFALMLRAGLDGVERDLSLAPALEEGLYTLDEPSRLRRGIILLPGTLGEALAQLEADEVMLAALGPQIAEWFVEAKTREWDEYRKLVHPWELSRYLPTY
jgi:glutamine synthetase